MPRISLPRLAAAVAASVAAALAVAAPAAHAQTVPFTGDFTGSIVSQSVGRCGPTLVTLEVLITGFVSPFGAASGTQSVCVDPGTFAFTDGLFMLKFVGAGDHALFGTFFGTGTPIGPQRFTSTSSLTFTGGTGRFTGATGTAAGAGTQDLGTGVVGLQAAGTVSAPGLSTVPEPATLALVGAGLAGLAAARRARWRGRRAA